MKLLIRSDSIYLSFWICFLSSMMLDNRSRSLSFKMTVNRGSCLIFSWMSLSLNCFHLITSIIASKHEVLLSRCFIKFYFLQTPSLLTSGDRLSRGFLAGCLFSFFLLIGRSLNLNGEACMQEILTSGWLPRSGLWRSIETTAFPW